MSFLGAAIVQSLVTGTVIALVAVALADRCRSAALRHAIELAGLFAMAIAFVWQLIVAGDGTHALREGTSWWSDAVGWAYVAAVIVLAARVAVGARAVALLRRSAAPLPEAWAQRIEV